MSERLRPDRSMWERFLTEALDKQFPLVGSDTVEIELRVNGVEVHFAPVLEEMCELVEDNHAKNSCGCLLSRDEVENRR